MKSVVAWVTEGQLDLKLQRKGGVGALQDVPSSCAEQGSQLWSVLG